MSGKRDQEFRQCISTDPEMATWVDLAREYLTIHKTNRRRTATLLDALQSFLTYLIIGQGQPRDPGCFLSSSHNAPPIDCAVLRGDLKWRRQKKNKIYDFLRWILEKRFSQQLPNGRSVVLEGYRIPYVRSNKSRDEGFLWLTAAERRLEAWRRYGANYLGLAVRNRHQIRVAIQHFFEKCIVGNIDRFNPSEVFHVTADLPGPEDLFPNFSKGSQKHSLLALGDFLDWVLNQERALSNNAPGCDWRNPYPPPRKEHQRKQRMDGRSTDQEFKWILEIDPEMEMWRVLAANYTSQVLSKQPYRWRACSQFLGWFLDRYIVDLNQPRDPLTFLDVDYTPPLITTVFKRRGSSPILYDFGRWILREGLIHLEKLGRTAVRSRLRNPFVVGTKIGNKTTDASFFWLAEIHPELEEWRRLGEAYTRTDRTGIKIAVIVLGALFSRVIAPDRRHWKPTVFFRRDTLLASTDWIGRGSEAWRGTYTKTARDFADWVLTNHLSVKDDKGREIVPSDLKNPFEDHIGSLCPKYNETNKVPLPYRYIDECRRILNQGPSFRDWVFAQGTTSRRRGNDWFEVPYTTINHADPDCVWQEREVYVDRYGMNGSTGKRVAYFLWCPARAVAVYMKLLLPLRTYQVRVLDSGEMDTFRFCPKMKDNWSLNTSPHSRGSEKRPHQRGVFRRFATGDGEHMTGFYINTNKTADAGKDSVSRGYFIPWQYDEALQWLAKLRDWQEKYNPIKAPTSWSSLDHRHVALKSQKELLALGETCFLFRDAAAIGADRVKPIRTGSVESMWGRVCRELEERIYSQGTRLPDGERIPFARLGERCRTTYFSLFPLHSLRVSLLTLFALEGGVPLVYLSKLLAGHARLLMTIYYVKPGIVEITETMAQAVDRLGNNGLEAEVRWLAEAAERDLRLKTAYNDRAAPDALLGGRPGAGWIWDTKGVCPVGRARCVDGGPLVSGNKERPDARHVYSPVPGGPGNCVRCRFFITGPAFLPGLVAHLNLLLYRFGELGRRYQEADERITSLKNNRDAGINDNTAQIFGDGEKRELCRLEVEFERVQSQIDHVGRDVVSTHKLIQRSRAILNQSGDADPNPNEEDPTVALVAAGCTEDVRVSLEEVTELHQLSVLCENAMLYPESEDDAAIYRRSQLIDAALEARRLEPLLCRLSREEQLHVGNHMIRFLTAHAGSLSRAVGILECADRLSDIGLVTDAIRSVGDRSKIAKPVSLATLSRTVALNEPPPRQALSAATSNSSGGI